MAAGCGTYLLLKDFAASLAVLSAAAAWLVNRLLAWIVWVVGRRRKRFELMRALVAEISSNAESECIYDPATPDPPQTADRLLHALREELGPMEPLAIYVAATQGNPIYETLLKDFSVLSTFVSAAVVRYYSASVALTEQIRDFRSESYLGLSRRRQEVVIRSLYAVIGAECGAAARLALTRLRRSIWRHSLANGLLLAFTAALAVWIGYAALRAWPNLIRTITQAAEWASTCGASKASSDLRPI